MKLNASVEVTASMCAGGVANAIYNWLKNGKPISTEELAEQILVNAKKLFFKLK
jgi:hypothetical protein